MNQPLQTPMKGDLLSEDTPLDLQQVCRICCVSTETLQVYVAEGVIEPIGAGDWRFQAGAVHRVRAADRLARDLGVNAAGAALVLDLMDEVRALRHRLERVHRP